MDSQETIAELKRSKLEIDAKLAQATAKEIADRQEATRQKKLRDKAKRDERNRLTEAERAENKRRKLAEREAREAIAQAKRNARIQDKADRERSLAERKAIREAQKASERNGVKVPKKGTICREIWELCAEISDQLKTTTPLSYIMSIGLEKGYDKHTLKTQYSRWKKHHGITGRVPAPKIKIDL